MAGEKAQRLADAMAAMSQGDFERFGDILLADDVVWHWPGRSSLTGDYHGREATLELMQAFLRLTGGRLNVEPMDILEGEDHLMSFTHVTADREGAHLDIINADAMRFGPDGRVVEYWTLSNDQEATDAFLG